MLSAKFKYNAVAPDVLAHGEGGLSLCPGKFRRIDDLPQGHGGHGTVGHLNAHNGNLTGNGGDPHAGGAQAQSNVIGAGGELTEPHALVQLHLVPGDAGTPGDIDDVGINAEAGQGLIQPGGIFPHFLGADGYDFSMEFYNPDGSSGMMCGNGGRCIVAFSSFLGLVPADGKVFRFVAADGEHTGEIVSSEGDVATVRLGMIDCSEYHPVLDGWFLNTGTRHFVKFVDDVESLDIESEGKRYRWDEKFAPLGVNANFVQRLADGSLKVRTFEKGVEAETLACGTGLTACAIASWLDSHEGSRETAASSWGSVRVDLHAVLILQLKLHSLCVIAMVIFLMMV